MKQKLQDVISILSIPFWLLMALLLYFDWYSGKKPLPKRKI